MKTTKEVHQDTGEALVPNTDRSSQDGAPEDASEDINLRFQDSYCSFLDNLSKATSVNEILIYLYIQCKKPISSYNSRTSMCIFVPSYTVSDTDVQACREQMRLLIDEYFESKNAEKSAESIKIFKDNKGKNMLCAQAGKTNQYYIFIWDVEPTWGEQHITDYINALAMIKMRMSEAERVNEGEHLGENELIMLLLSEKIHLPKETVFQWMRDLGFPVLARYYVILTDVQSKSLYMPEQIFDLLQSRCKEKEILCGVDSKNRICFIVPAIAAPTMERRKEAHIRIEQLRNIMRESKVFLPITIGVGCSVNDISEVCRSYTTAEYTLEKTSSMNGVGSSALFCDVSIYRFLGSSKIQDELKVTFNEIMQPLYELSENEVQDLFKTVSVFVQSDFNVRECSRRLFVHHNTVRYRLEKLQNLCGINLRDPSKLFEILLCLEAIKIRPELMEEFNKNRPK